MLRLPSGKAKFIAVPAVIVAAVVAALPAHEGRRYVPYWDAPGRAWTVCAGVTGKDVVRGRTYTSAECDGLERRYVETMFSSMGRCVTTELSFNEMKAWGDFAYNVGTTNFCRSTAASLLNAGKRKAACREIPRWRFVGGKDCALASSNCAGIVTRRAWEQALCEGGL